jgi:ethanolamine utilization protein EutA (predicted chaperonin)
MEKKKVIKLYDLRHARMTVENLHNKLKDGYYCEGDELVSVINAMMNMLHDVVQAAEEHKVTLDGAKIRASKV